MIHAPGRDAQLESSLPELTQIRHLTTRERLLVGASFRLTPTAIPVAELTHGLVHHLGCHRTVGRELPAHDGQHAAGALDDDVLAWPSRGRTAVPVEDQRSKAGPTGADIFHAKPGARK